jgi:hypothetical protein
MRQKEKQDSGPSASGGGNPTSALNEFREQANRFLAVGDEAIDRALANSDSEAFLRANRQQGGQ